MKKLLSLALLTFPFFLNGTPLDLCCDNVCDSCVEECGEWFVTADFIYWKPHEDNLVYAIDGVATSNSGSSKELDWKWYPGFKVGVGYALPCSIDTYLNYTWYRARAQASSTPQNLATPLFPTFAPDATDIATLTFGSSDWTLHYYTLDFELGDWFCLGKCFVIHPSIGLRGAFTSESDHFVYAFPAESFYNFKQRFNGVGPRLGFNSRWDFCNKFSLFADGALAIVWGQYDISFEEIIALGTTLCNTDHTFDALRCLTDIRIGFDWNAYCWNNCLFILGAAWEHRLWFNHNQYLRFNFTSPSAQRDNDGDLSLYGLDVYLKVIF